VVVGRVLLRLHESGQVLEPVVFDRIVRPGADDSAGGGAAAYRGLDQRRGDDPEIAQLHRDVEILPSQHESDALQLQQHGARGSRVPADDEREGAPRDTDILPALDDIRRVGVAVCQGDHLGFRRQVVLVAEMTTNT